MSTLTVKPFNKIVVGDILLKVPNAIKNEIIATPAIVIETGREVVSVLFPTSKSRYGTGRIYADTYNALIDDFAFFTGNEKPATNFDLAAVQQQLRELVSSKKILPLADRINEELFNFVIDGELPSQEEMRILLLRYHKALQNSEENISIYDSVIFNEEEGKTKEPEPAMPNPSESAFAVPTGWGEISAPVWDTAGFYTTGTFKTFPSIKKKGDYDYVERPDMSLYRLARADRKFLNTIATHVPNLDLDNINEVNEAYAMYNETKKTVGKGAIGVISTDHLYSSEKPLSEIKEDLEEEHFEEEHYDPEF